LANQNIADDDPYSKEHLSMYFDPFVYKHTKELKIDEVNINNLIIVFWDINKFSYLVKQLKALMKRGMKKQVLIFHEIEYMLRDHYSKAARAIKKNNRYWTNL
jgi:hypothetical protein